MALLVEFSFATLKLLSMGEMRHLCWPNKFTRLERLREDLSLRNLVRF